MSGIEDAYREHQYEEGMALARSLSAQITGGKGIDPTLLHMLAAANHAGVIRLDSSDQGTNPQKVLQLAKISQFQLDLEALGIDTSDHPLIETPKPSIQEVKFNIVRLRASIDQVIGSLKELPSESKLNLMLKLDIPNDQARAEIIQLFFTSGMYTQNLTTLSEALDAIDNRNTNREQEEANLEAEQKLLKTRLLIAGSTTDEVAQEKERRGIKSKYEEAQPLGYLPTANVEVPEPEALEEDQPDNVRSMGKTHEEVLAEREARDIKSRYETAQPMARLTFTPLEDYVEDKSYLERRDTILPEYCKSSFRFCVSRLAQLPENMLWIDNPQKFRIHIPENIQQKLTIIAGMSETYGFTDYTKYLEGALRAYMRVYFGFYNDEALRAQRALG